MTNFPDVGVTPEKVDIFNIHSYPLNDPLGGPHPLQSDDRRLPLPRRLRNQGSVHMVAFRRRISASTLSLRI